MAATVRKKAPASIHPPVLPTLPTPRRGSSQHNSLLMHSRPASSPNLRRLSPRWPNALAPIEERAKPPQSAASRRAYTPPDLANVNEYFRALEQQIDDAFAARKSPTEQLDAASATCTSLMDKVAKMEERFSDASTSVVPMPAPPAKPMPAPPTKPPSASGQRPQRHRLRPSSSASQLSGVDGVASPAIDLDDSTPPAKTKHRPAPPKPKPSATLLAELLEKATEDLDPIEQRAPATLAQSGQGQSSLRQAVRQNMQRVMDIFQKLDLDASGEVDRSEFRKGMRELVGHSHALEELDELFDFIDTSGDGRVSYRELYRTVREAQDAQNPAPQPAPLTLRPAPPAALRSSSSSQGFIRRRIGSAGNGSASGDSAGTLTSSVSVSSGLQARSQLPAPQPPSRLQPMPPPLQQQPEERVTLSTLPPLVTPARAASAAVVQQPRPPAQQPRPSLRAASATAGLHVRQCGTAAPAPAPAAPSTSNVSEPPSYAEELASLLHPHRRKEVLRLYRHFRAQHAKGVCRVSRFDQLLRLKFPTEDRAHIDAMLHLCVAHEKAEAEEREAAHKRSIDVAAIFEALDTDNKGTLDLEEFLQVWLLLAGFSRTSLSNAALRTPLPLRLRARCHRVMILAPSSLPARPSHRGLARCRPPAALEDARRAALAAALHLCRSGRRRLRRPRPPGVRAARRGDELTREHGI